MPSQLTTSSFFMNVMIDPVARDGCLKNPEAMNELHQFTPQTVHDIYPAIDVHQAPGLRQEGKVVLVTGAGRGIGRETAITFAKAGARALVICARTLSQLEETEAQIHEINSNIEVLVQQVDVSSDKDVKGLFDGAVKKFEMVDVVVNNAGINHSRKMIVDSDSFEWWREVEVNLKGLFLVSKYFIQSLAGKQATLISMSSTTSLAAIATQSAYAVSKDAGNRFIENLHFECPNISVYSLHPGIVDTELIRFHNVSQYGWTMDSASLAAGTCLYLTTPAAKFLRGRWISATWRVDELEERREEIMKDDLLKTGINARLGKGGHEF